VSRTDHDLLIAGGGLSAGLIALALRKYRPDLRVAIVEAGGSFGGNHTWSSFESDLHAEGAALAAPLIAHRWPVHLLRFPAYAREIALGYQSATSDRLHAALADILPPEGRLLGTPVVSVEPGRVTLADQRVLTARAVLDARGQRQTPSLKLGFQKFVGLEVELARPHGLPGPIIMDATVDQHDGYRFVYTLPFAETRVLIEDTYYADGPALDRAGLEGRVRAYAAGQGWEVTRVVRQEHGVLPIAIGGDIGRHLSAFPRGVPPVGLAAGLFHPVTGYSFPDAVRLALHIAKLPDLSGAAIDRAVRTYAISAWDSRRFYRLLNKMLFHAAEPAQRWRVLQHFNRLDAPLVGRFYAGGTTFADKVRILSGKPPVPISRAVAALVRA
jgi:lycopene beta-cyclase